MGRRSHRRRHHEDTDDGPKHGGSRSRVLRALVQGNAPFSPFTNVPWALVVAGTLWILALLTSRSAFADVDPPADAIPTPFHIAWVWILFALGFLFYAYKYTENLTMILAPERWWALKYIDYRTLRRVLRQGGSQSWASFTDIVSLFFAFPLVFSLLLYATQETWPQSFLAAPLAKAGAVRHVRFLALAIFLQHGVGFSSIVSLQFSGDVAALLVSLFGAFINLTVLGSMIGFVVNQQPLAERLGFSRV